MMSFNFVFFLTVATFVTGIIWLYKRIHWGTTQEGPSWLEQSASFFPVLLIVLVIRTFVAELYYVPTGSLKPTVLPGELTLVNKFEYGLRLPISNKKWFATTQPKAGDIVVFFKPNNLNMNMVKRVIGTPGDHISYVNKVLYVNGERADQRYVGIDYDQYKSYTWPVADRLESLSGVEHHIFVRPDGPVDDFDVIVPANQYFMMGDNRDNSGDSREWGFVSDDLLVGKASRVIFSWDQLLKQCRWSRFGKKVV